HRQWRQQHAARRGRQRHHPGFRCSSNGRDTSSDRDWSSVVCSADLQPIAVSMNQGTGALSVGADQFTGIELLYLATGSGDDQVRSEERRVGKERRSRGKGCNDNEKDDFSAFSTEVDSTFSGTVIGTQ